MNHLSDILSRHIAEPAARQAQAVAEVATVRQVAEARALRMRAALARFAALLTDPANTRGGVILLPVPWGSGGRWGLSRDERDTLRAWVVAGWQNRRTGKRLPSPFEFDISCRRWLVMVATDDAAGWLATHQIGADDVLKHWPHRRRGRVYG